MGRVFAVSMFSALVLAAGPAAGDTTIRLALSTDGAGALASDSVTEFVIYIKGARSRTDFKTQGTDVSILKDVSARTVFALNHSTRHISDLMPAGGFPPPPAGVPRLTIKAIGQPKAILGRTCLGYTYQVIEQKTARQRAGRRTSNESVTYTTTGTIWMATSGPGVADWRQFVKAANATGIPDIPLQQAVQDRAVEEIVKELLPRDAVPFETELRRRVERKDAGTGKISYSLTTIHTAKVTSISVEPIPDAVFEIPLGYTKRPARD
jgi:hypothetical protein